MKQQKTLILFCYSALIISTLIPGTASLKVSQYHIIIFICDYIFGLELLMIEFNGISLELTVLW